ncbi:protein of unknown function [Nitrospira japonica]|uniref:Uncharacterized protein n=1 Tax=Nitrospira japonica TaxID=1325564 RepID=A0A1W1I3V2_9BACT|nr:protein of unknown function [Nitrospira japonica]
MRPVTQYARLSVSGSTKRREIGAEPSSDMGAPPFSATTWATHAHRYLNKRGRNADGRACKLTMRYTCHVRQKTLITDDLSSGSTLSMQAKPGLPVSGRYSYTGGDWDIWLAWERGRRECELVR